MSAYLSLALAIVAEVIGTSAVKASEGFTRLVPSAIVVAGYGTSFYFMSLAVRAMPVGIVYAVWSGVGIVLISAVGWVAYGQKLDVPALIGLSLIIVGVLVVNLSSTTVGH